MSFIDHSELEALYQHFKSRLIAELCVDIPGVNALGHLKDMDADDNANSPT